jgi:hypothetical protein
VTLDKELAQAYGFPLISDKELRIMAQNAVYPVAKPREATLRAAPNEKPSLSAPVDPALIAVFRQHGERIRAIQTAAYREAAEAVYKATQGFTRPIPESATGKSREAMTEGQIVAAVRDVFEWRYKEKMAAAGFESEFDLFLEKLYPTLAFLSMFVVPGIGAVGRVSAVGSVGVAATGATVNLCMGAIDVYRGNYLDASINLLMAAIQGGAARAGVQGLRAQRALVRAKLNLSEAIKAGTMTEAQLVDELKKLYGAEHVSGRYVKALLAEAEELAKVYPQLAAEARAAAQGARPAPKPPEPSAPKPVEPTPPVVAPNTLRTAANQRLGTFVEELQAAGQRPATAIVAYDVRTGAMVAVTSGEVPAVVAPELAQLAQNAGGLGVRTACGNTIGKCAEFRAANQLLQNGSRLQDIRFTKAVRPRTGKVIPTCENCQQIFGSNLAAGN